MFYLNFDVAEHVRKNLYTFIMIRENLINASISDFTCHVNLRKDSEPYQVYIDSLCSTKVLIYPKSDLYYLCRFNWRFKYVRSDFNP